MLQAPLTARSRGLAHRLPDALLVAANVAILVLSGGEVTVFLVSIVFALTIRYVFLSALVAADARSPGWFAGSRLRRMVRDPDEGGAYDGGGAETPIWGHFAFLAIFGWIPTLAMLGFSGPDWVQTHFGYVLAAALALELRDIAVGRVVYFRSGAGQRRNASWNFTQLLALAATLASAPVLIFPALIVQLLHGAITPAGASLPIGEIFRWAIAVWILGAFHALLYLHEARSVRAPAAG